MKELSPSALLAGLLRGERSEAPKKEKVFAFVRNLYIIKVYIINTLF